MALMALNCYVYPNSIIYLYNSNGSFTNLTWQSPGINSNSLSFDYSGNLVLASPKYGIYIFGPIIINSGSDNLTIHSLNDSCIFEGIIWQSKILEQKGTK